MLKIDGLSHRQLRRAFKHGRLPYLKRLSASRHYTLKPFYSGVSSTTPVVQAELFFGVQSSLPAIAFYDREEQKKHNLLMPWSAGEQARKLAKRGRPLLEGGRSYSNIYAGGAEEARYCVETMRLRSLAHMASSVKLFVLLALQPAKLLQMLGFGLLEVVLALTDFFSGVLAGREVFKELKFVPTRVLISILLRELIRTRVKMDVTRGVPIVHASFLGYDEQAHRRGPGSAFAHWSLKGIDDTIREIHRAARHSDCRRYALVVYADHGQEAAVPYGEHAGGALETAVARAIRRADGGDGTHGSSADASPDGLLGQRARGLFGQDHRNPKDLDDRANAAGETHITAMGPLGHVYLPTPPDETLKRRIARHLVEDHRVPMVLYRSGGGIAAQTVGGRFDLAANAKAVLGSAHAFAEQAARDLAATCRHPLAGDFVISGWSPEGAPVTFAVENGAHGGPGREETRAFVLLPTEMDAGLEVLRPLDLREQVLAFLNTAGAAQEGKPAGDPARKALHSREETP